MRGGGIYREEEEGKEGRVAGKKRRRRLDGDLPVPRALC